MEQTKKSKGLIWLIGILIILVLGLVGYVVYDKVLKEDNENFEQNPTTTNTTTTTTVINQDDIVYCGEKTSHLNNNINFKFYYKKSKPGIVETDMYVNNEKINTYSISDISYIAENDKDNYTFPTENQYDNSEQINIEKINDNYYLLSYYVQYESSPSNLYMRILDKDFNSIYDFEIIHMTVVDFEDVNLNIKFDETHFYIENNEIYYYADKDGALNQNQEMPVYKLTIKNGKIEKNLVGYYAGTMSGLIYGYDNE